MSEPALDELRQQVRESDVFEWDPFRLINERALRQYPHRDRDRLAEVISRHDTASAAADALGCSPKEVRKWAEVYGLEYPYRQQTTAGLLKAMSADDLRGGQA
ncbi:hypothetical protein NDI85_19745 [Halomicroarcula sp. S1AR25-4]|uniref:hypothetical protein n=1 Tax=Haloarcula sp. S1AR25-4 TaxID=2950538 RepID=UPI002876C5D0|nr:hypothetical protein [Halomicroarcula sp. S1AR25-4]MDS0280022.1 hypothetical protein [Halomicroarcula sp. S1AR25-4]